MIKTLPKCYRKDPWVNELYNATDTPKTEKQIQDNYDNIFFFSLTEEGCSNYEHDLNITPAETLEERRKNIQRAWLWRKKCTLVWLNDVAQSYDKKLSISYDGNATLTLTSNGGYNYIKNPYAKLLEDLEIIKPAHMIIKEAHKYVKWINYYNPVIWETMLQAKWSTVLRYGDWKTYIGRFYRKTWGQVHTLDWSDVLMKGLD